MSKIPHRCPVCEGRGTMPSGFYSRATCLHNTAPETCQTCYGQGIIWSIQREAVVPLPKFPEFPLTDARATKQLPANPPRTTGTPLPIPEHEIIYEGQTCYTRKKK